MENQLNHPAKELQAFEEDYLWVHKNYKELARVYDHQWIGVKNHRVIAYDSDLPNLIKQLKEQFHEPACTVVEFISPMPMKIVG